MQHRTGNVAQVIFRPAGVSQQRLHRDGGLVAHLHRTGVGTEAEQPVQASHILKKHRLTGRPGDLQPLLHDLLARMPGRLQLHQKLGGLLHRIIQPAINVHRVAHGVYPYSPESSLP